MTSPIPVEETEYSSIGSLVYFDLEKKVVIPGYIPVGDTWVHGYYQLVSGTNILNMSPKS